MYWRRPIKGRLKARALGRREACCRRINTVAGWFGEDRCKAAQHHAAKVRRLVQGELKRIEPRIVDADLMPDGD